MDKKVKQIYIDLKNLPPITTYKRMLFNFIFGLLQGTMITVVSLGNDSAVLISYLLFYFFLNKVLNRPKSTSSLATFIEFPIPTSIGAYIGYKLAPWLSNVL